MTELVFKKKPEEGVVWTFSALIILWQDWEECAFSIKEMETEAATGCQNWTWNLSLKILKDPSLKKKLSVFYKNPFCVPTQNFIDAQDLI